MKALAVLVALAGTAHADSFSVAWRAPGGCVGGWFETRDALAWAPGMDAKAIERRDRRTGKPLAPLAMPAFDDKHWMHFATPDTLAVSTLTSLVVLDAATGKERWRTTYSKNGAANPLGRDVLVKDEKGKQLVLERRDGATGKVLWHTELSKPKVGLFAATHLSATRIYLTFDEWSKTNTAGKIAVLDAATGKTVWTKAYREPRATDINYTLLGGDTMALAITGKELVVFDPATGAMKKLPFKGDQFDAGTGPDRLYTTDPDLVARDLPAGGVAWTQAPAAKLNVERATANGLFTLDDDHVLRHHDAKTGAVTAAYGLGEAGRMYYYEHAPHVVYCEGKDMVALDVSKTPAEDATITGRVHCDGCEGKLRVRVGDAVVPVDGKGTFTAHATANGQLPVSVIMTDGLALRSSIVVKLTGAHSYAVGTAEVTPPEPPGMEGD